MSPWQAIGLVTSGLALAAFIVAAAMILLRHRLAVRERLITQATDKARAALVAQALESVHIETGDWDQQRKYDYAIQVLVERRRTLRIWFFGIIILAIIAAAISAIALLQRGEGGLYVSCQKPGRAIVVVDGVARGSAPLRVENLSAGWHAVECRYEGGVLTTMRAEVQRGETRSIVVKTDDPTPAIVDAGVRADAAPPEPKSTLIRTFVDGNEVSGISVQIDDSFFRSPFHFPFRPGQRYRLRFSGPRIATTEDVITATDVFPSSAYVVQLQTVQRRPTVVQIFTANGELKGATIGINDGRYRNPVSYAFNEGQRYQITATFEGFKRVSEEIVATDVFPGESYAILLEPLKPLPPRKAECAETTFDSLTLSNDVKRALPECDPPLAPNTPYEITLTASVKDPTPLARGSWWLVIRDKKYETNHISDPQRVINVTAPSERTDSKGRLELGIVQGQCRPDGATQVPCTMSGKVTFRRLPP